MNTTSFSTVHEWRAIFVRLLAYVCGLGALSVFGAEIFQTPVVASVEHTPRAEWMNVVRPHPAFEMTVPNATESQTYTITRHIQGGGRKDTIIVGEPGRSVHAMLVEIYRPGTEIDAFADPTTEIAAHTTALGPAGAVKPTLPIETKFGTMAAMDFMIGPFSSGHCVGFQRSFDSPRLEISGYACSMDSLVSRDGIACALDRLTLLSSGADVQVAGLFARGELNRKFCGQREVLLAPTPKRPGDGARIEAPKLRGRFSAL